MQARLTFERQCPGIAAADHLLPCNNLIGGVTSLNSRIACRSEYGKVWYMTSRSRWIGLIVLLAICLAAGGLGGFATSSEISGWYRTIEKPSWNPPDYIFGPVWTTLYILMAVAAWLVWKPGGFIAAAVPLTLFGLQLVLNVLWSWVFFGMHQPGYAFAEIIVLWLAIAATTWAFAGRSKIAAGLLLPYLAWVSFASVLNFTIWRLNVI